MLCIYVYFLNVLVNWWEFLLLKVFIKIKLLIFVYVKKKILSIFYFVCEFYIRLINSEFDSMIRVFFFEIVLFKYKMKDKI